MTKRELIRQYITDLRNLAAPSELQRERINELEDELAAMDKLEAFNELDLVKLKTGFDKYKEGTEGTIVLMHEESYPSACMVELFEDGETIGVETVLLSILEKR